MWPAAMKRTTRSRSSSVPAIESSRGMSCSARACVQPRSRIGKFGSSKNFSCGSERMNATDRERWVTRERAWWLTT